MASIEWLCLLAAIFSNFRNAGGKTFHDIRLPKSIVPEHYRVGIIPDIHHSTDVKGFVDMEFFVQSSTDRIVMHSVNLTLEEDSVSVNPIIMESIEMMQENDVSKTSANEKKNQPKVVLPIMYDTEKEFVIINLASKLEENRRYRASFNFSGKLATNLKGFYRSDYVDLKSKTKKYGEIVEG